MKRSPHPAIVLAVAGVGMAVLILPNSALQNSANFVSSLVQSALRTPPVRRRSTRNLPLTTERPKLPVTREPVETPKVHSKPLNVIAHLPLYSGRHSVPAPGLKITSLPRVDVIPPDSVRTQASATTFTVKPLGFVQQQGGKPEAIISGAMGIEIVHEGEVLGHQQVIRILQDSVEMAQVGQPSEPAVSTTSPSRGRALAIREVPEPQPTHTESHNRQKVLQARPLGYVELADGKREAIIPDENGVQLTDILSDRERGAQPLATRPGSRLPGQIVALNQPPSRVADPPTLQTSGDGPVRQVEVRQPSLAINDRAYRHAIGTVQIGNGPVETIVADASGVQFEPLPAGAGSAATYYAAIEEDTPGGSEVVGLQSMPARPRGDNISSEGVSGSAKNVESAIPEGSNGKTSSPPITVGLSPPKLVDQPVQSERNEVEFSERSKARGKDPPRFLNPRQAGRPSNPSAFASEHAPPMIVPSIGYVEWRDGKVAGIIADGDEIHFAQLGGIYANHLRVAAVSYQSVTLQDASVPLELSVMKCPAGLPVPCRLPTFSLEPQYSRRPEYGIVTAKVTESNLHFPVIDPESNRLTSMCKAMEPTQRGWPLGSTRALVNLAKPLRFQSLHSPRYAASSFIAHMESESGMKFLHDGNASHAGPADSLTLERAHRCNGWPPISETMALFGCSSGCYPIIQSAQQLYLP